MVFSALLQFSIINYIHHFEWKTKAKKYLGDLSDGEMRMKKELILQEKSHRKAKRIDFVSKVAFPAVFLSFNIIYWTYYLNVSNPTQAIK